MKTHEETGILFGTVKSVNARRDATRRKIDACRELDGARYAPRREAKADRSARLDVRGTMADLCVEAGRNRMRIAFTRKGETCYTPDDFAHDAVVAWLADPSLTIRQALRAGWAGYQRQHAVGKIDKRGPLVRSGMDPTETAKYRCLYRGIKESLTPKQRRLLACLLRGEAVQAIAARMGKTRNNVQRDLLALRKLHV
jgi:DNA-binding CsgD family transcriptional regulator